MTAATHGAAIASAAGRGTTVRGITMARTAAQRMPAPHLADVRHAVESLPVAETASRIRRAGRAGASWRPHVFHRGHADSGGAGDDGELEPMRAYRFPGGGSAIFTAPAMIRSLGRVRIRSAWPWAMAGGIIGALAMYYLDPHAGRRRRALVRDKFAHAGNVISKDVPRTVERRGRFFRGVAKGVRHNAAELVRANGHGYADDETLVARVRSEALRDQRFKSGEIHVDAYEGTVTLRGQVDYPGDIRRLVEATKRVDGVTRVRSYLHLPDEPPPNKAQVYEEAERHLPAM